MSAARHTVRIVDDPVALAAAAAAHFAARARQSVASKGSFSVALSGGSTPRATYRLLAAPPHRESVPWSGTVLFVGDERAVPPDHPDSNYRMIHTELLSQVALRPDGICRFHTEMPDRRQVVERYEASLRARLGLGPAALPRLDLVLLGLGPDGHTAGLFPGSAALGERERLAAVAWVEKLGAHRYSLTLPALNRAAEIVFLVAGQEKAEALRVVLEEQPGPDPLPAQRVRPENGTVLWLVDRAAACGLSSRTPIEP